ncbi:hypothetical protein ABC382_00360 [Lysinibacillus sp. 1P01SD]|uniref:hypothetical protein n=1 Tax=Lysinibacillus sp. 1P01SD TaxID=3132285 RepID=UPI0039A1167E
MTESIQSFLIEGFDQTKGIKSFGSSFESDLQKIISAQQNEKILQSEVITIDTTTITVDGEVKKVPCAVVYIGDCKGILPIVKADVRVDDDGVYNERDLRNLQGRTIAFVVERYEYDEGSQTCTFLADRLTARQQMADLLFRKLEEGSHAIAVVHRVTETVVIADIGGVDVYMNARDIRYGWIDDLQKEVKVDDQLEVVITKINAEKRKVEASARLAQRNPWDSINKKYHRQKEYTATVSGVRHFGVFVRLEHGLDCLCPHLKFEALNVGDKVTVRLIRIDQKEEKIDGKIVRVR